MSNTRQRTGKRGERFAKEPATLPAMFTPRFLEDADGRQAVIKEIRQRMDALVADTAAESVQQMLLCQRATFIAVQLETMETNAIEGKEFDSGKYTVLVNSLLGVLRSLGLDKKFKQTKDLKAYLENKQ
jgi:hypothetical protein